MPGRSVASGASVRREPVGRARRPNPVGVPAIARDDADAGNVGGSSGTSDGLIQRSPAHIPLPLLKTKVKNPLAAVRACHACRRDALREDGNPKSGLLWCSSCGVMHQETTQAAKLRLKPTPEQAARLKTMNEENKRVVGFVLGELSQMYREFRRGWHPVYNQADARCSRCKTSIAWKQADGAGDDNTDEFAGESGRNGRGRGRQPGRRRVFAFHLQNDATGEKLCRLCYRKAFDPKGAPHEEFQKPLHAAILEAFPGMVEVGKTELWLSIKQAVEMWQRWHLDSVDRWLANRGIVAFLDGCRARVQAADLSPVPRPVAALVNRWLKDPEVTAPQHWIYVNAKKKVAKDSVAALGSVRDAQVAVTAVTCHPGGKPCRWLSVRANGIRCAKRQAWKGQVKRSVEFRGTATKLARDSAKLAGDTLTFKGEELEWYRNDYIRALRERSQPVYTKKKGGPDRVTHGYSTLVERDGEFYIVHPLRGVAPVMEAEMVAVPVVGAGRASLVVFDRTGRVRYVRSVGLRWKDIRQGAGERVERMKAKRRNESRERYRRRQRHLRKRLARMAGGKEVLVNVNHATTALVRAFAGRDGRLKRATGGAAVSLFLPEYEGKLSLSVSDEKDRRANRFLGMWPVATFLNMLAEKARRVGIYPAVRRCTVDLRKPVSCPDCGWPSTVPTRDHNRDGAQFVCMSCGYAVDFLVALARHIHATSKPVPARFDISLLDKKKSAKNPEGLPSLVIRPRVTAAAGQEETEAAEEDEEEDEEEAS